MFHGFAVTSVTLLLTIYYIVYQMIELILVQVTVTFTKLLDRE